MIRQLVIQNFKSIVKETIPIGRFTVMIGENGAGKSNILEALVMASAASKGKLERELLIGRGIRVPHPQLMRSAFNSSLKDRPIKISITHDNNSESLQELSFSITHDGDPYSDWKVLRPDINQFDKQITKLIESKLDTLSKEDQDKERKAFQTEAKVLLKLISESLNNTTSLNDNRNNERSQQKKVVNIESRLFPILLRGIIENSNIERFTVYAPEYYTLRNFISEGQTSPLGTRGEGLLQLLSTMYEKESDRFQSINDGLKLLGWFNGIDTTSLSKNSSENRILVKDRFIKRRGILLDQISTNEGFLFCLFYLTLLTSKSTPNAFAIENIETGLNPKLTEELIKLLKKLGIKYKKQVIVSSHSPSVLDALNLDDQDDVLLAVDRNLDGHTRVTRINKPRNLTGKTTRLSELFLKGLIGGVPKNFL
ncbi:MAG: AAA family ATPase [Rhodoferax sp.]